MPSCSLCKAFQAFIPLQIQSAATIPFHDTTKRTSSVKIKPMHWQTLSIEVVCHAGAGVAAEQGDAAGDRGGG